MLIYFKKFKKFSVGLGKSSTGRWWHNIRPRNFNGREKDKTARFDSIIGINKMYRRSTGVYTYHVVFFKYTLIIGPFKA